MSSDSSELISASPQPTVSPWRSQLAGTLFGRRNANASIASGSQSAAGRGIVRALVRNPSALAGLILLAAFIALALSAGHLFPGDPLDMVAAPFEWPGADHQYWLGTDSLGRDVAAGIAHGTRVSLLIGAASAAIGLVIGTLVGATGGFFGGVIDDL